MENKTNANIPDAQENPPVEFLVKAFGIADPLNIERVSGGLIHATYKLCTQSGEFCLQALHPKLSSLGILEDYAVVTQHMEKKGFPAPALVKTVSGEYAAEWEGVKWRLTTWIEGESRTRVENVETAQNAAELLGRFHMLASDLDYEFKSNHPLHDTVFHMKSLEIALSKYRKEGSRPDGSDEMLDFGRIQQLGEETLDRLTALQKFFEWRQLPRRVVHGDPKISNILFKVCKNEVAGLVDLDTCSHHTILVDLGDAVRSWTPAGPEENSGTLRMDILEAILAGYRLSGITLSEEEIERIPSAGPLITWELCSRFLRDVVEDSYFGWDPRRYPSRRAHNMARAESMAELARQMEKSLPKIEKLVKKHII